MFRPKTQSSLVFLFVHLGVSTMDHLDSVWSTWYRMCCPLCTQRIARYESRVDDAELEILRHVRQEHGPREVCKAKALLNDDSSRYIVADRQALPPNIPAGRTQTNMMWSISCPHNDRCHHTRPKKEEK